MHTLWLPYRNLEENDKNRHGFTSLSNTKERKRPGAVTEEEPSNKKFQYNRSINASSSRTENSIAKNIAEENRPARQNLESGETNKGINSDRPSFISASNLPKSSNDREPSLLNEGVQGKQVQTSSRNAAASTGNERRKSIVVKKNVKNTAAKQIQSREMFTEERCITGDVSQITKVNKDFPNDNILYELYGNIYKICQPKCSTEGVVNHRTILLRNKTGPIVQGIFYEIDKKMPELKTGDCVRCVGKFMNSSQLHILKIDVDIAQNRQQLLDRLNSIGSFLLVQPK